MGVLVQAPEPVAVSQALFKVAFIVTAVLPEVLTVAFGQAVDIFAFVELSVGEVLVTLAVFEPILEMARVQVA